MLDKKFDKIYIKKEKKIITCVDKHFVIKTKPKLNTIKLNQNN